LILRKFWFACFALGAAWADCPHEVGNHDERCSLDASAFLGLAVDTFAAGEYGNYVYPAHDASSASNATESSVFGFNFAFRVTGARDKAANYKRQLWIYGETIHGVRSADIDCATSNLSSCQTGVSTIANPVSAGQNALYIVRNASSLEGYVGFRWEFVRLNQAGADDVGGTPVNVYLKAQAGFLKVAGSPGSALDMHKVALGLIATKGNFTDSHLDVGYGRNDVFQVNRRRRVVVDAYVQRKIPTLDSLSVFMQMVVDTDLGRGSDSFQTYIGANLDLGKLFGN
jgi:hypothetical protein